MKAFIPIFLILSFMGFKQSEAQVLPFHPEIFNNYLSVRDLSLNENEIYFSMQSLMNELSAIVIIRKVEGAWTEPEIASFSGKYMDLEPFLAPDNLRLYFASNRPLSKDSIAGKDFDIWYVERERIQDPWSDAMPLEGGVNSEYNEFYPSISSSKNVYFTSDRPESLGEDDLFMALWDGEKYALPVNLGEHINSPGYEFNAYVNPAETILLFTAYNRADGFGSGDLYISRKKGGGEWTSAENLGPEINSDKMDYCPFYDERETRLYFTSRRSKLKPDDAKKRTFEALKEEIEQYENGLSRLYQIEIQLQ